LRLLILDRSVQLAVSRIFTVRGIPQTFGLDVVEVLLNGLEPELVVGLEVFERPVTDQFLHVAGFVEDDRSFDFELAALLLLCSDADPLLAVEVRSVGDIRHLSNVLDRDVAAEYTRRILLLLFTERLNRVEVGSTDQRNLLDSDVGPYLAYFPLQLFVFLPFSDLDVLGLLLFIVLANPEQRALVSQEVVVVLLHCARKRYLSEGLHAFA